jgi:acyl-CoA reductase-like NAD-dependent aldehyde dehydrogenase
MATVEQHATEIHNGATNGAPTAAAGAEIPVENPATGEIVTTVPDLDAAAVADLGRSGRAAKPPREA